MLRVQQRFINTQHANGAKCKNLAFRSKNIYNLANYYICQYLLITGDVLVESEISPRLKESDGYKSVAKKVSFKIIKHLKSERCLHQATTYIIDRLVAEAIGTFVSRSPLGGEKLEIKTGSIHPQNFTSFYQNSIWGEAIIYKTNFLRGIKVGESLQGYTNKCSLTKDWFKEKGRPRKRGLFNAAKRQLIEADFYAAFNIIRTVFENKAFTAFDSRVAVQLQPGKVNPLRERYFTNKKLRDTCFYLALPSFFVAA